ncbi:MAG: hypothetical protein DRH26_09630 [Deltaproteobacteria bacterium]|nr:MAG: hypothetical protein DRH26_09630 [Deltaproteobacteria bacterium]
MKLNDIFTAWVSLFLIVLLASPAFSAQKQFTPLVTITDEYTDNFNHSKNNKDDEFSTRYQAILSFEVIDKQNSLLIEYSPNYIDYMDKNEYDSWNHGVSIDAVLQPSKNTILTFSDSFDRSLNRTVRTNTFEQHDTNTSTASLRHQFGQNDYFSLSYTYTFDNYDTPNQDEFKTHRPSAYMMYWFTPKFGMDLNASYSKTDYEISTNDLQTLQEDLRFLKKINPHLDAYVKYAHTYTEQTGGDHVVYNPSIGFDWQPTEDSGIALGGGVLFQEYQNNSDADSKRFFLEFDAYKNFNFSRRNTLSITGSSSYNDINEEAASLGFTINYRAGFLHTYRLTRRLSSELRGSYNLSEYDEPGLNRKDKTLNLGAGLVWSPLRWLNFNFAYTFTDFNTDDSALDDYQEHSAFISTTFTPQEPMHIRPSTPRQVLENRLFN